MVGALTPALAPCGNLTASSDNLRDHYTDCAQRGDRKIPETGQRGRRRHACQSVSFPTRAHELELWGNLVCANFAIAFSSVPR